MATLYHNITGKVATAVAAIIDSYIDSTQSSLAIYARASMTELVAPRVEVLCSAEVEVEGATVTGNYIAEVRVRVVSNAKDSTGATHDARVAAVGDVLFRDDFVTLEAVSDFTMQQWFPRRVSESVEGSEFVTEFTCELRCWPSQ